MAHLIDKDALVAEIEKLKYVIMPYPTMAEKVAYRDGIEDTIKIVIKSIEVKEVDVSSISENLTEACEYLDYTHTSNLAHNKPMVAARLRKAIKELHSVGLFQLTHDEKYRMENLGLKEKKGE